MGIPNTVVKGLSHYPVSYYLIGTVLFCGRKDPTKTFVSVKLSRRSGIVSLRDDFYGVRKGLELSKPAAYTSIVFGRGYMYIGCVF